MNWETYQLIKLGVGAICTLGLYSVLYKENKFYRLFEHIYIGLAVGVAIVVLWSDTLHDLWWVRMTGVRTSSDGPAMDGHWAWMLLLPIGLLGYTVFNRKYNWLSRIPIGIIIGFGAGQAIESFWTQFGPGFADSIKPIFPTTNAYFVPNPLAADNHIVYGSQAVTNLIYVITIVCVLAYFLFSFEHRSKFVVGMTTLGRWLMMVGFGAIFGSTVAMRFSLVIDRMHFVFIEFLKQGILHR